MAGNRTLPYSLAVVIAGAAVAGGLTATARQTGGGPTQSEIDQVVAEVDAILRETTAETRSRAQTLADLPRMPYAVASDAATVRDLTELELAFRPRPDETIEIAQVSRVGGAPTSLLRIPAGSTVAAPLEKSGVHLLVAGDAARIAAVVPVEPSQDADKLYGVVAVSRMPTFDAVIAQLGPLGGVRLETAAGAVAIGRPIPPERATVAVPLGGDAAQGATLVVPAQVPDGWSAPRVAAAIAFALAGLVGGVLVWRRGRRAGGGAGPGLPAVADLRPTPRLDLPESFRIGRYSIIRRLGQGGMADVYLARVEGEAGFERLVALKVILDEMVSNPKFVSHFLDEARLASQLSHPNIVAITDLGKEEDKYVIAMEYVDGADLERVLHGVQARGGQIPVRVALAIVRHICDGLHFAHTAVDARGEPLLLVHRDVKTANVFVSRTGAVKIGDFGIAKIAGSARLARTEIGEVKGTAAYMAPEHRIGGDVDRRADVYAVGAICYELLTGRAINLDLAMLAHLGREGWPHLPPPSTLRPEIPPAIDPIVLRAMAFERDDRQPSCEVLELALAEVVESHGLSVTDKAIAQWIKEELALLPGAHSPTATPVAGAGPARG